LSCHLIGLLERLEVALPPFDFCGLAELDKVRLRFDGVFFFGREEVYLERIVLEEVRDDTEADACGAAGNYVDLRNASIRHGR
jgi:hypothetical protein